jgi:hypothetical protein
VGRARVRLRITLPCAACDEANPVNVELMATWWEWTCPACGEANKLLTSEKNSLGWRVLEKARGEYVDNKDYSIAIVLAAMAVEADIARLFFKWRRIDTLRTERRQPMDEEIDREYRELGTNIATKIESVARMLTPAGIDAFAKASPLGEQIGAGFPSLTVGSLAEDIQTTVFWPRNRIVHAGYLDYTADDARRITNVAIMVLALFKEMDLARRT